MKKITIVIMTENTAFGDLDVIVREAEFVTTTIEHLDKRGKAVRRLSAPNSLIEDVAAVKLPLKGSKPVRERDERIVYETVLNASGGHSQRINILESARRAGMTLEQIKSSKAADFPVGSVERSLVQAYLRQEIMRKRGRGTTPLPRAAE